jgi:hypothetical protein
VAAKRELSVFDLTCRNTIKVFISRRKTCTALLRHVAGVSVAKIISTGT